MNRIQYLLIRGLVAMGILANAPGMGAAPAESAGPLGLAAAVDIAVARDPWLAGSHYTQAALADEAIAAATLPDPKLSLMAGNFPVDTFELNQEAMTQVSVGLSQMFPRGDTLALSQQQKQQLAQRHPLLRADRRARVRATVTQLWLEVFRARESVRIIEADRGLFEHLVDAAEAGYASTVGRTRQQDLIRAQLELTRLEDRLTVLKQQEEAARRQLWEWLGGQAGRPIAGQLPALEPAVQLSPASSDQERYEQLRLHPVLQALDLQIAATATDIELARQQYRPEWGISAQYGYRDDDPMGRDRADLFSLGVTFDLPLFTANRQDRHLSAAVSRTEAIRTEKQLLSRRLVAQLESATVELTRLEERHVLYAERLLPQMSDQAEAALAAYNNDDGDFAEAVRARIAELNARIEALVIAVERQKTIARINYLLAEADPGQPGAASNRQGE